MSLPNYPIPNLRQTLKEISRVLKLSLSANDFANFEESLQKAQKSLEKKQEELIMNLKGKENWATDEFKTQLLSLRCPIPSSTSIPVLLERPKLDDHLKYSALLLWSISKLKANTELINKCDNTLEQIQLEQTQESQLFSSARIPGNSIDQITVTPNSRHAVVLYKSCVFPINIQSDIGEVLDVQKIYEQIISITRYTGKLLPSICKFTALDRTQWYAIREGIVRGEGRTTLEMMESAIVALAIEDSDAHNHFGEALNNIRFGSKQSNCMRYYDKIINIIVYKNCDAGLIYEHCAIDGMVAAVVTQSMQSIVQSYQSQLLDISSSPILPLNFKLENQDSAQIQTHISLNNIITFDYHNYSDLLSAIKEERMYECWINVSLQLALKLTFGDLNFILVTPTHMRHFKHGRSDPTYTVSKQSLDLIEGIISKQSEDVIFDRFIEALAEYKKLVKSTKLGEAVGPNVRHIRQWLESDLDSNGLKLFLQKFATPSVYLTGFDSTEGIACAAGNVYANNQLAVTYLGRKEKLRLVITGSGLFSNNLENLRVNLQNSMHIMSKIVCKAAIASQMGTTNKTIKSLDVTEFSKPFSIAIHGGAGERMLHDRDVLDIVNFALKTALSIGVELLSKGESSLNAVEQVVVALENCFLFNAGKGSVYNRDGQHELEACIIDGKQRLCGSVACLKTVKNPVKAARLVLESSGHVFLVGDGAEQFCKQKNVSLVKNSYFDTDIRLNQLLMSRKQELENHPQTVGAVAIDIIGSLSAASSTGGLVNKLKGRISDTCIVGAGLYADEKVAVACTGNGENFIRNTIAGRVAALHNNNGYDLKKSCNTVINDHMKQSFGGIIAIDSKGDVVIESNADLMFYGFFNLNDYKVGVMSSNKHEAQRFVICENGHHSSYLHSHPPTPGTTIVEAVNSTDNCIFSTTLRDYKKLMIEAKRVANIITDKLSVNRCAMITEPKTSQRTQIRLIPLHNISSEWKPIVSDNLEFHSEYKGYCTSKNGPRALDSELDSIQAKIRAQLKSQTISNTFYGDVNDNNLFARIIRGEEQQWRVWEDKDHVAFLTPFPNTPGFTVIVPRKHLSSDIFSLGDEDYEKLMTAAYSVCNLLKVSLQVQSCAMIFEGYEIDFGHIKLIPIFKCGSENLDSKDKPIHYFETYEGFISSLDGSQADNQDLVNLHQKLVVVKPPSSWRDPTSHSNVALTHVWYKNLFELQNTLFHSTVEFFHDICGYSYVLTPLTTDTISSPLGLGSDSQPVHVNLLNDNVFMADSMQFALEYFLRLQNGLRGTYYVSPSFRGEDPDSTHLNQFYHIECELLGNICDAMTIAEKYIFHITNNLLMKHKEVILRTAGNVTHVEKLLQKLKENNPFPKIKLDEAIKILIPEKHYELVFPAKPEYGYKLTREGERKLIEKFDGPVWLTEMDHLGVPFYQSYVDQTKVKARAADLLIGLGETLGLGERHCFAQQVKEALAHHMVPEKTYEWYINMRLIKPLQTSGWGLGSERYLCWLLNHNDIRDMQIIPRMKGKQFLP